MLNTPQETYALEYTVLGIKNNVAVPFTYVGTGNNAGMKNVVGDASGQTTQNPIAPSGDVRSSASTGYDDGIGWWIGFDGGTPKFFIGNSDGNKLTWDGDSLFISGQFNIGGTVITIGPNDDIQTAINTISAAGGGTLYLTAGTFNVTGNIVVPSNTTIRGAGSSTTIIDFGGGAFQIQVFGSNGYTTGTVSITHGGTNVTGSGTTFTAAMVGQSILLADFWYTISAFNSVTSIDIDTAYSGITLSGSRYAIATLVENVHLESMTVENSSVSLIKVQYASNINYVDLVTFDGNVGFEHSYVANINANIILADSCGTGWILNDVHFATFFNFNALNCTGIGASMNYFANNAFDVFAIQGNGTVGMSFSNSNNVGLDNYSVQANGTFGIEFVTTNSDISFVDGTIFTSGSDGIKLTASSNAIQLLGTSIKGNGGYGVNIAASSSTGMIISSNFFATNSSGAVNDSGTGTIIRGNYGVDDNGNSAMPVTAATFSALAGEALAAQDAVSFGIYQSDGGILLDTSGGGNDSTNGTTTVSINIGSNSNRVLVIVTAHDSTDTVGVPAYNGSASTLIETSANGFMNMYYLVAPTTGTHNLTITHGTARTYMYAYYSFYNVAVLPIDGHTNTSTASATSLSYSLTPAVPGEVFVSAIGNFGNQTANTSTTNMNSNNVTGTYNGTSAAYIRAGWNPRLTFADSTTVSGTWAGAQALQMVGISMTPFTAAVPSLVKASAADAGSRSSAFTGFSIAAYSAGATATATVAGAATLSSLTAGKQYYLSDTLGAISTVAGTVTRKVGIALSTTKLLVTNIW